MTADPAPLAATALLLCDMQNDFLHPDGAYGRAGLHASDIAVLPDRIVLLARKLRHGGGWVCATQFTLVPGQLLARFCGTGAALCVDLHRQVVDAPDSHSFGFDIDQRRRVALLEGLDDIAQTLSQQSLIDVFQAQDRLARPWLWLQPG